MESCRLPAGDGEAQMNKRVDAPEGQLPEGEGSEAPEEERVITVGWKAIGAVAAVLVLVGGFLLGRLMAAEGQPSTASGAAPQAQAPIVVTLDPNLIAPDPGGPYADQGVIELPRRGHPLLGQPAPDFAMQLAGTDQEVKLSDYRGKAVMVNFWATWCPPCRIEMPWIQSIYQANQDKGFVVLAVDAGERVPPSMWQDTVIQFTNGMGLTFPVLLGDNTYEVQRQWDIYGLPATFMIDAEGKVVDYHTGMFPNEATLDDRIQELLAPTTDAS
jgi:thiol-disulfide isomerase/thioredoxin